MQGVLRGITQSFIELGLRLLHSVQRVPLYFWVYLAVIGYVYKRMLRDFLGVGTKRCRIIGRVTLPLTKEEEILSASIVDPDSLTDTFETVGGLDEVKSALTESVVWPYQHPELLDSAGVGSALPTGVLLYGPPGTGKTLLARALAKELGCYFIEVSVDKLFSKYVGESEKLAAAVFSLAHKLRNCVIFVDEIDALLSSRGSADGGDSAAVYTHAKTIFMTKWDGLTSASQSGGSTPSASLNSSATPSSRSASTRDKILVLGATNRVDALDDAILRRLSVRMSVPLPDAAARRQILEIQLRALNAVLLDDATADDMSAKPAAVQSAFDHALSAIAADLRGYTGSDIREVCKAALMISFRGKVQALKLAAAQNSPSSATSSLTMQTTSPLGSLTNSSTTTASLERRTTAGSIIRVSNMRQAMTRVKASGAAHSCSNGDGNGNSMDPIHRFLMRAARSN